MPPRLLVVDDEDSILVGLRRFFQANGYSTDCAREREEAGALLDCLHYDCVIVDLCLTPDRGADGLDLIAELRARRPSVPIVALTAYGSDSTEAEARRVGASAFLRKPQALPALRRVVDELMGRSR
ncbi:MAG TPA: response regulator [Vicinamibacteria bacterium]|nr:response regulator [Vicinamibacteria bacterium]